MRTSRAKEGEEHRLVCKVSGSPQPTVEWLKNNKPVIMDSRIKTSFDGKNAALLFEDISLDDEGNYKCVIKNDLGSASSNADMFVDRKSTEPEIIDGMNDAMAYEASEGRFDIHLKGIPKPKIEWYHGVNKITDRKKYYMIQDDDGLNSLVITNVRFDDAGIYKCVASNEAGKVSARASLEVKPRRFAPEFEEPDSAKTISTHENNEVHISFRVKGNPKPEIVWFKDKAAVRSNRNIELRQSGDTYYFILHKASPDDDGRYKCEATNELGSSNRRFNIEVKCKCHVKLFNL